MGTVFSLKEFIGDHLRNIGFKSPGFAFKVMAGVLLHD